MMTQPLNLFLKSALMETCSWRFSECSRKDILYVCRPTRKSARHWFPQPKANGVAFIGFWNILPKTSAKHKMKTTLKHSLFHVPNPIQNSQWLQMREPYGQKCLLVSWLLDFFLIALVVFTTSSLQVKEDMTCSTLDPSLNTELLSRCRLLVGAQVKPPSLCLPLRCRRHLTFE